MLRHLWIGYEDELNENLTEAKKIETLLCAAVGTARHQHGLGHVFGAVRLAIC